MLENLFATRLQFANGIVMKHASSTALSIWQRLMK
jgi:hypothetical protein